MSTSFKEVQKCPSLCFYCLTALQRFAALYIFSQLIHVFLCFPSDDFADEEEVQSFGYKRFGEYQVTSTFTGWPSLVDFHWSIIQMIAWRIFSLNTLLCSPPTILHKVKRPHLVSQKPTYFWLLLQFFFYFSVITAVGNSGKGNHSILGVPDHSTDFANLPTSQGAFVSLGLKSKNQSQNGSVDFLHWSWLSRLFQTGS